MTIEEILATQTVYDLPLDTYIDMLIRTLAKFSDTKHSLEMDVLGIAMLINAARNNDTPT